jgi:hypothetical protein
MTVSEMHTAFKLGLDKSNSASVPAFEPNEIDYWLNYSVERFIKQRLSGNNPLKEKFPNTDKRYEDLYTLLVSNPNLGQPQPNTNSYVATQTSPLPKDFFHLVFAYCGVLRTKDPYNGLRFQRHLELMDEVVYNSRLFIWNLNNITNFNTTQPGYYRLLGKNEHTPILTNPSNSPYPTNNQNLNQTPTRYIQAFLPSYDKLEAIGIDYIRKWQPLNILTTPNGVLELPDSTHQEVVDIAVSAVLENIGDPRYNTNINQLNSQE